MLWQDKINQMSDRLKSGFVVITPTLVQGNVLAWLEGEGDEVFPVVFDTMDNAWREIADGMISDLRDFIDGNREFEDTNFEPEDYVAMYDEDEDGKFTVYNERGYLLMSSSIKEWRGKL